MLLGITPGLLIILNSVEFQAEILYHKNSVLAGNTSKAEIDTLSELTGAHMESLLNNDDIIRLIKPFII